VALHSAKSRRILRAMAQRQFRRDCIAKSSLIGLHPGTVIIDTPNTYLYFILSGGQAIRYGVGIGREGFTWSGIKTIERKTEWPM
jgi:lipoprotein-anchoring transpeptidase ErfK/SrfK